MFNFKKPSPELKQALESTQVKLPAAVQTSDLTYLKSWRNYDI